MTSAWTLPLVRIALDNLPIGRAFILARDDAARLFGATDSATRLISVFGGSHGCRAVFKRDELVFHKRLPSPAPAPMDEPSPVEYFPPLFSPPRPASDHHPAANCR